VALVNIRDRARRLPHKAAAYRAAASMSRRGLAMAHAQVPHLPLPFSPFRFTFIIFIIFVGSNGLDVSGDSGAVEPWVIAVAVVCVILVIAIIIVVVVIVVKRKRDKDDDFVFNPNMPLQPPPVDGGLGTNWYEAAKKRFSRKSVFKRSTMNGGNADRF